MSENIPYIIAEDGYYYVAYKEKVKVPEIVVSSKGVANGLSEEYNDGWDFGPDSYSPTSTSAIPYTETVGIQEAHLYRVSLAMQYPSVDYPWSFIPPVKILSGTYICNEDIIVYPNNNGILGQTTALKFEGEGRNSITQIIFQGNSVYGFDFSGAVNGANVHLENLNLRGGDTSLTSLVNAQIPSTSSGQGNYITIKDVQLASGSGTLSNGILLSGISYIDMPSLSDEISGSSVNFINISNATSSNRVLWVRVIGLRGASHTINIDALINSSIINLKDTMNINITSGGTVLYLEVTGVTAGAITNAGTVYSFILGGTMTLYDSYITNSGTIYNLEVHGFISPQVSSGNFISDTGTIGQIAYAKDCYFYPNGSYALTYHEPTPTISANPPVSGTVYQNTNPYDIEIDLPAYASTSGTAGYVTVAKGSTDTPTAIANQYISGDTSSSAVDIVRLRVPAGWYYEFTSSGVTFGTASVFAE